MKLVVNNKVKRIRRHFAQRINELIEDILVDGSMTIPLTSVICHSLKDARDKLLDLKAR